MKLDEYDHARQDDFEGQEEETVRKGCGELSKKSQMNT